ncbi:SDR family oxidoreductase [Petroclostridium sp. X23]|uniref:SDR family oxidoreductase n=1 Tax=Petroclostridium sp. X23 TaxID=3045146 RepID=UPI0024AE30EA|nr:SDR family oxidoreductase [Petroclostridium sp. X23]WHH58343.1 SDR family oxidoreductase [Petroclostridium sp. X23]
MYTYLVTGGAGFIGSNIVDELVRQKQKVVVLDNLSTGTLENLKGSIGKVKFIQGDITDLNTCREAMKNVDYVIHQAALPSVKRSIDDIVLSNVTNIQGTLNILEAAKQEQVKKVVFASSSSVYGNTEVLPKAENMRPDPLSPYALQKLTGEMYCRIFYQIYGVKTVCLRYFNVFGPRQSPDSEYSAVIPIFINRMLHKMNPVIYGDGNQSRDFTYVDNVVKANLLACLSEGVGHGETINIGGGCRTTLNDLISFLCDMTGYECTPDYTMPRKGDVSHSLADLSKAKELLGYGDVVSIEEGLRRTVEWFKLH